MRFKKSIVLLLLPTIALFCLSWGTLGHERINRAAVLLLPDSPGQFFYNHLDFITQESTVPDLRKYTMADKAEYPRHYADLEHYGHRDSLPADLAALHLLYPDSFISANGSLPWHLLDMMDKLTRAFREKRKTEILFLAADLGHYLGDAHMPLHTTVNHDGQLTGQRGIHAFWEAHLPELFADGYRYTYRPAQYLPDVRAAILDLLYESHRLAATLLSTERALRDTVPYERRYALDASGKQRLNKFRQPVHSTYYARLYHQALNGMVEKQLNKAIQATADFWYTAWINAGSPSLNDLDSEADNRQYRTARATEIANFREGRLHFPLSEKEF